ncbi:MAG: diguanylate cyclase [Eubacterium sp.]|nr:diguanylate cyclase [Eubacterium sp.]
MYYSAIVLLAVLILLIENQDILLNNKGAFEKTAWKIYRRFLFAVLAYYITDVLWGALGSLKQGRLLFADTTVYFVAMATGVLFWTQYTVAYLEEKNWFGQTLIVFGRILAGLITGIALLNNIMPVLFTIDSSCEYHALPARYILLAGQVVLLLLVSIYSFSSYMQKRFLKEKTKKYQTLGSFGLIMAGLLFIQLWFPYLPLYTIAYMLGTCLLHTYIINDEKEEYRRGLEEAGKIAEMKDTIASLLDNMPAMTFTKDATTGVYLACNQAFAEYAHKDTPAGVVGLTDEQIFDADTAKHFMEDDQMALSMDVPYIFFEDVHDAAGNQRQLQTTKLKYHNFTGQLCVLGICQDVTDQARIRRENATTKEAYEKARGTGIIYTHIAQALARGYTDLYYINLDTEGFIEYRTDEDSGSLSEVRRGWHFFEECRLEAEQMVYEDDRAAVLKALDRKNLVAALDRNKIFVMTYRLISEKGPTYVTMKVSRMEDDEKTIILGVTDVDEEMKQRRETERIREQQIAYSRLNALTGDFLCVYVVAPETGVYREFSAASSYDYFAQAKTGLDFFAVTRDAARDFCHPDDRNRFLSTFTKENVLGEIRRHGIFTLSYRLMMEGRALYVQLKAALVEEKEGDRLIVGINDIDSQVRQEEEYVRHLARAQMDANIDALTGVKNRHAYLMAEERLNIQIAENRAPEFAIVILDVNDLKKVNDNIGHNAGDRYLKDACKIICDTFKHSPVFRIGGDEFAVISQGRDYSCIEELTGRMNDRNAEALQSGGIVIACGMAKRENDTSVAPVFERADQNMYENKSSLKEGRKAD